MRSKDISYPFKSTVNSTAHTYKTTQHNKQTLTQKTVNHNYKYEHTTFHIIHVHTENVVQLQNNHMDSNKHPQDSNYLWKTFFFFLFFFSSYILIFLLLASCFSSRRVIMNATCNSRGFAIFYCSRGLGREKKLVFSSATVKKQKFQERETPSKKKTAFSKKKHWVS